MRSGVAALIVLCSLVASAPLAAQRTFIVDAQNGPGTNFTDLAPALAQAQHGDVYVIRAGTYGAASTDKGVALLGQGGVLIDAGAAATPALTVANLPAGTSFTLKQIELAGTGAEGMSVQSCNGRVHLAQLRVSKQVPLASVNIDQCREVTMVDVQLVGTLRSSNATLVVTSSTLRGQNGVPGVISGTAALAVAQSTVVLADGTLTGGDGYFGMGATQAPAAALYANGSDVALAATAPGRTALTGGSCNGGFCSPVFGAAAASLNNSVLRYSSGVVFSTQYGGSPFTLFGTARAIQEPLPGLVASGGTRGGTLSTTIASAPGDPLVLVLGLPADPVAYAFGLLAIDFNVFVVLVQGTQGPSGATTLTLPVPGNPQLAGKAIALQAASFDVASGRLFFTNPAVVVLD